MSESCEMSEQSADKLWNLPCLQVHAVYQSVLERQRQCDVMTQIVL